MKLNLEINNQTNASIKKAFFSEVVKKTLTSVDYDFVKDMNVSVSFALVSKEEIKRLNRVYRKKNYVTDVLSFAEYKNLKDLKSAVDKDIFLGELVLCYDDIREYAKKEKIKPEQELAKVVSHGVLHLLGMRHGKAMFEIQEKISKSI